MSYFYLDNAISWAQFRIRGGWRSAFGLTSIYAVGAILTIVLCYQLQTTSRDQLAVLENFSIMTLVAQIIILTTFASNAIGQSIRRDRTGLQIESHRLMPLPAVQAVAGYIAGGGVRLVLLAAVNLVIGIVLCAARSVPSQSWIIANGVLFVFSVSIWSIMVLSAFVSRGIFWMVMGILTVATFNSGTIFSLVPALLVFDTPVQGRTIFTFQTPGTLPTELTGLFVGMAAQLILAILCIRAAARKYARDDALALTPAYSMAVFALWSVLSWFGISQYSTMKPRYLFHTDSGWYATVVGSLCASLIVGLLPVASVVLQSIDRHRRRLAAVAVKAKRWPLAVCLVLCVGFTLVILAARVTYVQSMYDPFQVHSNRRMPSSVYWAPNYREVSRYTAAVNTSTSVGQIALASAIFFAQMAVLMRMLYPIIKRANVLLGFAIAALWFAPMLGDVFYYTYYRADLQIDPRMDTLALCSPVGTFLQAVVFPLPNAWRGLAIQLLILATFFSFLRFAQSRNRPRRAARGTREASTAIVAPEASATA